MPRLATPAGQPRPTALGRRPTPRSARPSRRYPASRPARRPARWPTGVRRGGARSPISCPASAAVTAPGRAASARRRKNCWAGESGREQSSGCNGQAHSSGIPSSSRLVATTRSVDDSVPKTAPSTSHTASSTCSQLSSRTTRSMKRACRNVARGAPPSLVSPSAVTTASGTAAASVTAASSTTRTPPEWAEARRRVTSRANVVLPTPPGPTIVTSGRRSTRSANAERSSSRPSR